MINRPTIAVIIALGFGIAGIIGCNYADYKTPSPIANPGNSAQKSPLIFEKDVQEILPRLANHHLSEENQILRLHLLAGNRVEGEVSVRPIGAHVFAKIIDPSFNVIAETAKENVIMPDRSYIDNAQEYPWRFSFAAAANGQYILEVYTYAHLARLDPPRRADDPYTAYLRVSVYDK